jgi:hypothetical protein
VREYKELKFVTRDQKRNVPRQLEREKGGLKIRCNSENDSTEGKT